MWKLVWFSRQRRFVACLFRKFLFCFVFTQLVLLQSLVFLGVVSLNEQIVSERKDGHLSVILCFPWVVHSLPLPHSPRKNKKKSLLLFQNIYSVTGKKKVNMNIFFSLEMPLVLNKDMMICMFYLENFDTQKQFAFRQNLNYFLREY